MAIQFLNTVQVDTSVLYVDTANDKVGIGTDSPSYKLDVNGNVQLQATLYVRTRIQGLNSVGSYSNLILNDLGANVGIGTASPFSTAKLQVKTATDKNLAIQTGTTNTTGIKINAFNDAGSANIPLELNGSILSLKTGETEKMRITSTGNVGIGVTNPGRKLSVAGSIELTGSDMTLNTTSAAIRRGTAGQMFLDAPGDVTVTIDSNSNNTDRVFNVRKDTGSELFRIQENGNVGIGTTSPAAGLQVARGGTTIPLAGSSTASAVFGNSTSDDNYGVAIGANSSGVGYISSQRTDGTATTYNLAIQPNGGNVGIGTTSPGYKLHVNGGGLQTTTATGNKITYYDGNGIGAYSSTGWNIGNYVGDLNLTNNADDKDIIFKASAGTAAAVEIMRIDGSSGNVGIRTTSPGANLDVQPTASNRKVTRIANDVMSTYFYNTQADAILAWTCGSYYQAEVVITANQTNGGTYNNLYIRGIWSNNHTSHHWDELEHVGFLTGSTFTMSVGQNGATAASGRLELDFDYLNASFSQLNVRVTDFYGSHSYTIT